MARQLTAAAGFLLAVALGGCQMLESARLPTSLYDVGATCHSNAGTYHLPRRLINVTISNATPPASGFSIQVVPGDYIADRNETYCLDFLLSSWSVDRVGIQRTKSGLLERIFTKTDDRTDEIAKDVIQAAADLIASDRARLERSGLEPRVAAGGVIAEFQFDPFVEHEAREINNALHAFGYCLFLDSNSDPFVPAWSQEICRQIIESRASVVRRAKNYRGPDAVLKNELTYPRSGLAILDPQPVSRVAQERGILYRPELSHSLIILRNKTPRSLNSRWLFAASERVTMPNAAPAFLLEVKRAMFVIAETDVQFNNGMIRSVTINKPSELLAVSNLTVAAAQIIVQIPARTFTIFNNRAENMKALMVTNAQLIETLRAQNADAEAEAQARQGITPLRQGFTPQLNERAFNPDVNPVESRLAECLKDPAVRQHSDPVRTCQEIVSRNQ